MFTIRYFKADPSTFIITSNNGKIKSKGKGLSFFYNTASTSITAIPLNAQECPFIFSLQSEDFQEVKIQGQVTFFINDAEKIAKVLNFTVKNNAKGYYSPYVSDDPIKLGDKIIRAVQTVIQHKVQLTPLREVLLLSPQLVQLIKTALAQSTEIQDLGISIITASITAITPTVETGRALEAQAREHILKEADDAIYNRRKSSVEQERMVKEAELQTELSIQQKEQEIEEKRIENQREILRATTQTEQERLDAKIAAEIQRKAFVEISVNNKKLESEANAYAVSTQMSAIKTLPVENLKAMAMANMQPEQLMALAFDTMANNASKIGELNITPDLFGQLMKKNTVITD